MKTRRLTEMTFEEVSLVDKPANPGAHVTLFKRGEITMKEKLKNLLAKFLDTMPEESFETETPKEQPMAEVEKTAEKIETVAKADYEALEKRAVAAEAEVKKANDAKLEAEKIAKVEKDKADLLMFTKRAETDFANLPTTATEKGQLLKSLNEKLTAEEVAHVEQLLSAGNTASIGKTEQIGTDRSDLGNPFDDLQIKAKQAVEKGTYKTIEQAISELSADPAVQKALVA